MQFPKRRKQAFIEFRALFFVVIHCVNQVSERCADTDLTHRRPQFLQARLFKIFPHRANARGVIIDFAKRKCATHGRGVFGVVTIKRKRHRRVCLNVGKKAGNPAPVLKIYALDKRAVLHDFALVEFVPNHRTGRLVA